MRKYMYNFIQMSIVFFITLFILGGCVSSDSGGSSLLGGASDDPKYASTSIQTEPIPMVRQEYVGKTVAVIAYVNKTLSEYRYLGDGSVGILPEYLLDAGFQPIESAAGSDIQAILTELKYGQSDKVNPGTAAMIGEHLGARYAFIGEVNNYRVIRPKKNQSVGIPFFGGFSLGSGGGKITYDMQVSGRIVDVQTRAIIAAKTVSHKETFEVKGGHIATPWGSFNQDESVKVENNVGGTVLNHALNRIVNEVVKQLNRRPPPKS